MECRTAAYVVPVNSRSVRLARCLHQRDGFWAAARGALRGLARLTLASEATTSFGHMLTLSQLRLVMEGSVKVQADSHLPLAARARSSYVCGCHWRSQKPATCFPTHINARLSPLSFTPFSSIPWLLRYLKFTQLFSELYIMFLGVFFFFLQSFPDLACLSYLI